MENGSGLVLVVKCSLPRVGLFVPSFLNSEGGRIITDGRKENAVGTVPAFISVGENMMPP